jgi:hypothetical protein
MKLRIRILKLFLLSLLVASPSALADNKYRHFDFRKKAEEKKGARWTLEDWLAQKERNRMMDLWLAMYTPTPYEFFLQGSNLAYKVSNSPANTESDSSNYATLQGALGAYATVVGVEMEYENNKSESFSDLTGTLNLRIAGNAVQGTHLILYAGQRTRENVSDLAKTRLVQNLAGADLNIYLNQHFGISGDYRNFVAQDDPVLGKVDGSLTKAGVFIDFEFVRIFGSWYEEIEVRAQTSETTLKRNGIQSGLQFFF